MQASHVKHKVIFDTDPGVDDAVALYFALAHPDIDVIGITTTFGNVSVQQATTNALYLTRIAGCDIPVAQGMSAPLYKEAGKHPDFIHGSDGLGNLKNRMKQAVMQKPKAPPSILPGWHVSIRAKSRWSRWAPSGILLRHSSSSHNYPNC